MIRTSKEWKADPNRDWPGNEFELEEFEDTIESLITELQLDEDQVLIEDGDTILILWDEGKTLPQDISVADLTKLICDIYTDNKPDELSLEKVNDHSYLRLWWD